MDAWLTYASSIDCSRGYSNWTTNGGVVSDRVQHFYRKYARTGKVVRCFLQLASNPYNTLYYSTVL